MRRVRGSISQPSDEPLAMYSSILLHSCETRSLLERSSTTKSVQIGAKPSCSRLLKPSHRSRLIQHASGDRLALLGSAKSVEHEKQRPLPSLLAHASSW